VSAAWTVRPLGDRCLIVELGQRVDPEVNARVRMLAARLLAEAWGGVVDVVPAFTTVAIHYRPEAFEGPSPQRLPYQHLAARLEAMLAKGIAIKRDTSRIVEVPVAYGGVFGPDLEEVAARLGLSAQQVIELHAGSPHVVYMIGFAPGLPYIGGLDPRLAVPRRATPRMKIPQGTVAIAVDQTVIYPLDTPGGWNLIGRTPLTLFTPHSDPPCLLQPGDEVRFVPVSADEFRALPA
jgi:inhibitor of KinA